MNKHPDFKKLTKEQRIARHKEFLDVNWTALAAFSWQNYGKLGKGAVIVPEEDILPATQHPELKNVRLTYLLPEKDLQGYDCWGDKEKEWIAEYDPDERIILVVIRFDGGTSSYYAGKSPCPSEASRMSLANLN